MTNRRIVFDLFLGASSAVIASLIFQLFLESRNHQLEIRKFESSMKTIKVFCDRYSGWYGPDTYGEDAFEIHRIPGVPDQIVEGAIESLRVIAEKNEDAVEVIRHMSQIYKRDLLNYIFNDDTVRQWRGHAYFQSFDYLCAATGASPGILCIGGGRVALGPRGPQMVYYYGEDGYRTVSCNSSEIHDTYSHPTFLTRAFVIPNAQRRRP